MNATQPTGTKPDRASSDHSLIELLDGLANGRIDSATFLAAIRGAVGKPDATGNWEVLSVVDQFYRRGKLSKELFQEVRIGLAQYALGLPLDDTSSARPEARTPQATQPLVVSPPAVPTPAPATTPVPTIAVIPAAITPQVIVAPVITPPVIPAPAVPPPVVQPPESVIVTAPATPREPRAETKRASPGETAREIHVGDVLRNRYRIVGVLGQGGMGTVYEADDNYRLDIPPNGQGLAIKVLHTSVTKRAELFSELRREFQHLQTLSHPNIVRAFEFDRDGPVAFFTMELLNGSLLSQVLLARNRVRLDTRDAWAVVRDVGSAIAHAHSRNIVHGDINPQNIFITQRGNIRVLDFGASHAVHHSGTSGEIYAESFATPGYASCQVLEGGRPDARDDVFALACVAYLLLSGEHPFKNHSAIEARVRGIKPKRLSELQARQWKALRSALQWDREKRPADVAAWLEELDLREASPRLPSLAELTTDPTRPRRSFGFGLAMAALAVLAVAAGFWVATNYDQFSERLSSMLNRNDTGHSAAPVTEPLPDSVTPPPDLSGMSSNSPTSPPPVTTVSKPVVTATPPAAVPSPPSASAPAVTAPPAAPLASTAQTAARPTPPRTGGSLIELAADTVDVPLHEPSASVLVHRKGSLRSKVGFTWWTESGTAKPTADFAAVAPHVEYFDEGKATVTLSIRLTDTPHAQERSFYVVIDQPEEGATLGARALTMITLPGNQSAR
jgi:serine/threonine protein kinase